MRQRDVAGSLRTAGDVNGWLSDVGLGVLILLGSAAFAVAALAVTIGLIRLI